MTIVEACSITIDTVHDYTAILTAVQVYSIVVHLRRQDEDLAAAQRVASGLFILTITAAITTTTHSTTSPDTK